MKPGCFLSLALLSGLAALYQQWFRRTLDPPAVWYASIGIAIVAWLCVGAVLKAWSLRKFVAALQRCRDHLAPMHGQLEAAAGTVALHGEPIIAPLSGTPCAVYEYEIVRVVTHRPKGKSPETQRIVDFAGIGVAAAVVQGDEDEVGLFGFPDLTEIPYGDARDSNDRGRARRFVRETTWEDCSGLKAISGFSRMFQALGSSDDSRRHDWCMTTPGQCDWLPQAGDGDTDADRRESGYFPTLQEKRLTPGMQVVAVGPYVAEVEGLVTQGAADESRIRIYPGTIEQALKQLGGSRRAHVIGSVIVLILTHLIAAGVLRLYRGSASTQREWRKQFVVALKEGNVAEAERLLDRGLDIRQGFDAETESPLLTTDAVAVAKFLLDHGADPNQTDHYGMTPLMTAARDDRVDIARALIEAGADVNVRSKTYGTTALVHATQRGSDEVAEMLRAAGAVDDVVRARTGQRIPEDHPAVQGAYEYIAAIHAANPIRLKLLSASTRPATFEDVDWKLWHNSRPVQPTLVAAFVRDPDATITLTGPTGAGYDATWTLQMLQENGEWKVVREHYLENGYRED